MDDLVAIKLMRDDEIIRHYDRTLLDMVWLEKMAEQCTPKSAAHHHYSGQLKKERARMDKLEEHMTKRDLFN